MKPYEPEKLFKLWIIHFHTTWSLVPLPQTLTVEAVYENEAIQRAVKRLNAFYGTDSYVIDGWEMKNDGES